MLESPKVNVQHILRDLDWSDIMRAEDADYQLRFLDDSYEEWVPALVRTCCDESADCEKRRWSFEALLRVAPNSPAVTNAAACLKSSSNERIRRVPSWARWVRMINSPIRWSVLFKKKRPEIDPDHVEEL